MANLDGQEPDMLMPAARTLPTGAHGAFLVDVAQGMAMAQRVGSLDRETAGHAPDAGLGGDVPRGRLRRSMAVLIDCGRPG
jgi:hypothetical protein